MYLARFSYDVLPVHRQQAMEFIRGEVEAARNSGLGTRLLVPLTRSQGGAALQFEVELTSLDQLEQFRQRGGGGREAGWMRAFSEILLSPPVVEILRVDEARPEADPGVQTA
ncbi:hypothetical protein [Roseomonas sp. BN140053]|uniref:hypothetical protein n=1 Tax=Roseomonas sp. BN140053 TaxID=3391898 RepID=UPI0039EB3572